MRLFVVKLVQAYNKEIISKWVALRKENVSVTGGAPLSQGPYYGICFIYWHHHRWNDIVIYHMGNNMIITVISDILLLIFNIWFFRTMYFSMVHSHLNYGLWTWGFGSNRIIKLRKRCVRIITRSTYNAHTQWNNLTYSASLTCYSWIQWNSTINTNVTKYQIILPLSRLISRLQHPQERRYQDK